MTTAQFQALVRRKGRELFRPMPWREVHTPYAVLVSEIMLQQTQVERVVPKFQEFMHVFPSVEVLAEAPLSQVLIVWQGLGYNRRAKYLHQAVATIVQHRKFPNTLEGLVRLPGVGNNTAGAILAYAYNKPAYFVETNIRTVYFHHFFKGRTNVTDAEVHKKVNETFPVGTSARDWYYALMDYGAYLKKAGLGTITISKHYNKQSTFGGSIRQLRGHVIRTLSGGSRPKEALVQLHNDSRLEQVLKQLVAEGLVEQTPAGYYCLPGVQ